MYYSGPKRLVSRLLNDFKRTTAFVNTKAHVLMMKVILLDWNVRNLWAPVSPFKRASIWQHCALTASVYVKRVYLPRIVSHWNNLIRCRVPHEGCFVAKPLLCLFESLLDWVIYGVMLGSQLSAKLKSRKVSNKSRVKQILITVFSRCLGAGTCVICAPSYMGSNPPSRWKSRIQAAQATTSKQIRSIEMESFFLLWLEYYSVLSCTVQWIKSQVISYLAKVKNIWKLQRLPLEFAIFKRSKVKSGVEEIWDNGKHAECSFWTTPAGYYCCWNSANSAKRKNRGEKEWGIVSAMVITDRRCPQITLCLFPIQVDFCGPLGW